MSATTDAIEKAMEAAEASEALKKPYEPMWKFTYLEFAALCSWGVAFLLIALLIALAPTSVSSTLLATLGSSGMILAAFGVALLAASWLEERQRKLNLDAVAAERLALAPEAAARSKTQPRRSRPVTVKKPAAARKAPAEPVAKTPPASA